MAKNKVYIDFSPNQASGYPAGEKIYYECLICMKDIVSIPEYYSECGCGNISVDSDSGRFHVENPDKLKIYNL